MKAYLSRKRSRGFSLIEIMLVLGIISVLVGAAIGLLKGNVEEARILRAEADIGSIVTQLKTYEMMNLNVPTQDQGLEALVKEPTSEPKPRRWRQLLEKVPDDPWGNKYQYRYPGKMNSQAFDLFSLGPDRVEGNDDVGNWEPHR